MKRFRIVRKIQITAVSDVADAQDKVRERLKGVRHMLFSCQLNELVVACRASTQEFRIAASEDREKSVDKSRGWE